MDQCGTCTLKGDLIKCKEAPCTHHDNWYAIAQQKRIFQLETRILRLPKEAIEVEDQWQLVQDHLEDKIWDEAFYALKRLKNLQLNLHNLLLSKMTERDITCNDCMLVTDCTKEYNGK